MTPTMIVLAGLMGASGIILAAAAAHTAPGAGLDSAAYMLLFHATAVLSGTVLLQQGLLLRPMMLSRRVGTWQCCVLRRHRSQGGARRVKCSTRAKPRGRFR